MHVKPNINMKILPNSEINEDKVILIIYYIIPNRYTHIIYVLYSYFDYTTAKFFNICVHMEISYILIPT